MTVTISVADYGGLGQLTETFPGDFTFVESSPEVTPSGQTLTFNLVGDPSVSYTLTAPTTSGRQTGFSGTLEPAVGDGVTVGGPSEVTVTTPPAQPTASATRSFSPSEVEPDSRLVVTIRVADYGGLGQLTETFPGDFTFVESSPKVTPSGQTLTFNLVGDPSVSYTLTAPTTPGRKTGFLGNLEPAVGDGVRVGDPSEVTVTTPPAQPTASATRSFSPSEVEPDSRLVVTIRVADYGGLGQLTETFPGDFTFVESSPKVTPSGQTLTFNLVGDPSVSYTLTAPTTPGRKTGFLGNLEPAEGDGVRVGGPSSVQVRSPSPPPQVRPPSPPPAVPANRAPAFLGSSTTRSIDENSASGANVGAVVRATDADRDRLTYSLTGTDAGSFTINSGTGQIMVGAGVTLDNETKASYMVTVGVTDGSEDDSIAVTITVTNVDEDGMVRLSSMTPVVGLELTATLTDPDGGVTGTTWEWSKSMTMDGEFIDIDGATMMTYTPVDMDDTYYLRATVMYTDGHGPGKMEMKTTASMVTAGGPLIVSYDTNPRNGQIDKSEAITAINDYLFGEVGIISKADVIWLINLYLFG